MGFLDKLKSTFGDLFGDIHEIQKLRKEEADIYKVREKLAKEELEANEALLTWSNSQKSEILKNSVELYYNKRKEIIEALQSQIESIRADYLHPLDAIADKIITFEDVLKNRDKAEKALEKAEKNLDKKKLALEKEKNKPMAEPEKIANKEGDLNTAESELTSAKSDLENMEDMVKKTKIELAKFKFSTLAEAFNKLTEHEKTFNQKTNEIFDVRDNLIAVLNKELEVAKLEGKTPKKVEKPAAVASSEMGEGEA